MAFAWNLLCISCADLDEGGGGFPILENENLKKNIHISKITANMPWSPLTNTIII